MCGVAAVCQFLMNVMVGKGCRLVHLTKKNAYQLQLMNEIQEMYNIK